MLTRNEHAMRIIAERIGTPKKGTTLSETPKPLSAHCVACPGLGQYSRFPEFQLEDVRLAG